MTGDAALAAACAVLARIAVFVGACWWPIPNERGELVSPLLPQSYFDFAFYLESLARYANSLPDLVDQFLAFYQSPFTNHFGSIISGPAFPVIIGISGFASGRYWPLAIAYLAMGSALAIAWIYWLRGRGLHGWWLVLFGLVPTPVWFILVVSPDLLFAAEFAAFFMAYFTANRTRAHTLVWVPALVLMVLTRPNGFSVMLFVTGDALWSFVRYRRASLARIVGVTLLLIASGLYLYPYFVFEMSKAGGGLPYFGIFPQEYLRGIYGALPKWLDLPASWLSLLGAKLLYLTGLRPSYGETLPALAAIRAAPGIILLPGLLYCWLLAPWRERILVLLYFLPFLLGPAQDRYYLAIYPLLFYYGALFWQAVLRLLIRRKEESPAPIAARSAKES